MPFIAEPHNTALPGDRRTLTAGIEKVLENQTTVIVSAPPPTRQPGPDGEGERDVHHVLALRGQLLSKAAAQAPGRLRRQSSARAASRTSA